MANLTQISVLSLAVLFLSCVPSISSLEYGESCVSVPATPPQAEPSNPTIPIPAPVPVANTKANDPCKNATNWLACIEGRCGCQEGMVLSRDRKTCVSKIGMGCQTMESDPSRQFRACVETATCITGSDNSGRCLCEEEYLPTPNNETCLAGPGQQCYRTEDCNTNALLSCQYGKCRCDRPDSQIWDQERAKCLAVVGGRCNEESTAFIKRPCIQNAICSNITKQCVCNATHKETTDKRCLLNYNETCDDTNGNFCHPHYECIPTPTSMANPNGGEMKCGCNSTNTVYDHKLKICSILAGKSCPSSTGNKFCVERAICSERDAQCKCEPEYKASTNGTCVGRYRADCNLGTDGCDESMNLECIEADQKCGCKGNYTYSSFEKKCVGLIGSSCKDGSDCFEMGDCDTKSKECKCKPGFSPTPSNDCLVAHGKYCTEPNRCNRYDFLLCDVANQVCGCESPANMTFSDGIGKCVGLVGSQCYTDAIGNRKLECVGNATCTAIPSSTANVGMCACEKGYVANAGRKCEKGTSGSGSSTGISMQYLVGVLAVILLRQKLCA